MNVFPYLCVKFQESALQSINMGISQGLSLVQKQKLQQRLSPQQLLVVGLYGMPITELAEEVKNTIYENEALEEGLPNRTSETSDDTDFGNEDNPELQEFEAPETYDTGILGDSEDEGGTNAHYDSKASEMPIGQATTFIDDLWSQVVNYDLNEQQFSIMEFLIGSLDDNGYLTSSNYDIVDDLMFSQNIYSSEEEVEEVVKILQQFDPPGIGARDTRECLIIQLDRLLADGNNQKFDKLELLQDAREMLDKHYSLFINNNKDKLMNETGFGSLHLDDVFGVIRKLNPHPGLSLCESVSGSSQTVTPDFIIDTDQDGNISLSQNGGYMPSFHLSNEYLEMVKMAQNSSVKMSRHDKARFEYMKGKVDGAKMFIEAMHQRQHTLEKVMRTIIDLQHRFFITQNERDLNTLKLGDVASRTGLDISTVSRVCSSKYALVDGNLYKLSQFFKKNSINADGQEIDKSDVESVLRQLVDSEDKHNPYSDEKLAELLESKGGIKVSRRTINVYRKKLGIPSSSNRKS